MNKKTGYIIIWITIIIACILMTISIINLFIIDVYFGIISLVVLIPYIIGIYFMLTAYKS